MMDGTNFSSMRDDSAPASGNDASSASQPQRKATVVSHRLPDRLPVRVLQTSRAPAQLSLFLRPGSSIR
jgi:hypothetical protein